MARKSTKSPSTRIKETKKEADRKARETLLEDEEFETEEEIEDGDDANQLNFFGAEEEVHQEEDQDIFDYVDENYSQKGTTVVYNIVKDGHRLADQFHPLSWNKLQEKYGGGHYAVTAKTFQGKQYIKKQSLLLGDSPRKEETQKEPQVQMQTPPSQPSIDPNMMMQSMLDMFQKMQAMTQEEKHRRERDERRTEEKGNTLFFQMMSEQQKTTQELFMKLSEQQMKTSEALSNNFSKVIEKMDEKTQKMFDKLSEGLTKKQEFGLKEILALQKESENAGWEKFSMLMELVDARAAEKSGDDEGGGMISKLITGLLPLMANAGQAQAMQLQQQQLQQHRMLSQAPQTPQTSRGELRPSETAKRTDRGVRPAPNKAAQTQSPQRKNPAPQASEIGLGGMPTRAPLKVEKESFEEIEEIEVEADPFDSTPMKMGRSIEELMAQQTPLQKAVVEVSIPIIVEFISAGAPAIPAAEKTVVSLNASGINIPLALKEFTKDFMMEIAAAFQMPEMARPWFEEYYAHIENTAGVELKGSDQPTVN